MLRIKVGIASCVCLLAACFSAGCSRHDAAPTEVDPRAAPDDEKILTFFNWADDLAPDTIGSFEKLTGVKVQLSYFDSNETLRTRMLAGHSGFDVTVPSVFFFQRDIQSGAYLRLDKTKLPNLVNLDPAIMARAAAVDPGNAYSVVFQWGTFGIGFNEKRVSEALPQGHFNSLRVLFDPDEASRLAKCGINLFDDPNGVVFAVLLYLGKNPTSPTPRDLAEVAKVLVKIRPYIRTIDTSGEIEAMANGDICVTLGYNGDMVQARKRANEAKNGIRIGYAIPAEGSGMWITLLAIPRDAPHVENAYLFINYLMNPKVIDNVTNSVGYANALRAPSPILDPSIAADPAVYPTVEERKRLFVATEYSPETTREITLLWQKFKIGQ